MPSLSLNCRALIGSCQVWEEYSDEEGKAGDEAQESKTTAVRDKSAFAKAEEISGDKDKKEKKESKESKESKSKGKGTSSKAQPAVKKQQVTLSCSLRCRLLTSLPAAGGDRVLLQEGLTRRHSAGGQPNVSS